MISTVTVKYQTTIPKTVRDRLGIRVHDAIEWRILKGKAVVARAGARFLLHKNTVHVGRGDIRSDIEAARAGRVEKYR